VSKRAPTRQAFDVTVAKTHWGTGANTLIIIAPDAESALAKARRYLKTRAAREELGEPEEFRFVTKLKLRGTVDA